MSISRFIRDQIFKILFNSLKICKVKNNKVIFINAHSSVWNGNLKTIYDEMQVRKLNYTYIKILKKSYNNNLRGYVSTIFDKLLMFYHLCTAKYVIINDYIDLLAKVRLKKNTELIQVWHAGGAFKKFGIDSLHNMNNAKAMKNVLRMHSQYTKVIVSGEEVVSIYAHAFGVEQEKVRALGLPRADVFFDIQKIKKVEKEFKEKYNSFKNKKIILYAPTFRDSDRNYHELKLDLKYLCENTSDEYVFILKMHPFIKNKISIPEVFNSKVLDLSNEDISELMIVADLLITDYSSVIFEFAIMEKPMIFYAYDLEYYEHELRGFYYDYKTFVPGPIARTTEEVLKFILEDNWDFSFIKEFKERFNAFSDGKATKRFIDNLFE